MNIWLLTHSEERKKSSGTGIIVKNCLEQACHITEWSRVSPCEDIINLPTTNTVLIYPEEGPDKKGPTYLAHIENIIILDGTWQQARKMYNQSPYLKRFPHYEIIGESSRYVKRRNQKQAGLCTAEVAIHYLKAKRHSKADALQIHFDQFNQSP